MTLNSQAGFILSSRLLVYRTPAVGMCALKELSKLIHIWKSGVCGMAQRSQPSSI